MSGAVPVHSMQGSVDDFAVGRSSCAQPRFFSAAESGFPMVRPDPTSKESDSAFSVHLGPTTLLGNKLGIENWEDYPDARFSAVPDGQGGFLLFWPSTSNYRSRGATPFPEGQQRLDPATPVLSGM